MKKQMKTRKIGSTLSSDLEINHTEASSFKFEMINLCPTIPTKTVENILLSLLKRSFSKGKLRVTYNGANEWVIKARIEALKSLF